MRTIYKILFISLLAKLALSAWLPLSTDESYYWVWAKHLQLSYYDHPPFVAWLFWLGQAFENWASMVRWPAVLLGHAALLIWIDVLRHYFSPQQLLWFTLLYLFSPLTGPGSLIVTPDLPMLFFAAASVWCTQKLIQAHHPELSRAKPAAAKWAWGLGAMLGLGFLSKYLIVLIIPSLTVWAFLERLPTKLILKYGLYTFFGAILCSAPVWLWNWQNEWASFAFQADHGLGGTSWNPSWTLLYILGQISLIFPTILYFAAKAKNSQLYPLHLLAWPILGFFLFTSFRAHVEANWPILAYPPLIALSIAAMKSWTPARWTLGIWAVALVITLTHLSFQWLPVDENKLKTRELNKFENLIPLIENYEPVFARSYQMASKLRFETKRPIYKLKGMNRIDFYDSLPQSIPKTHYTLITEISEPLPAWAEKEGHVIKSREPLDNKHELVQVEVP